MARPVIPGMEQVDPPDRLLTQGQGHEHPAYHAGHVHPAYHDGWGLILLVWLLFVGSVTVLLLSISYTKKLSLIQKLLNFWE